VLAHRLILTPEAELRGRTAGELVAEQLMNVPVPGANGRPAGPTVPVGPVAAINGRYQGPDQPGGEATVVARP
jgi:hypothetical protein